MSGTLTKAHIIDTVAEKIGYTRKKSIETVEIVLELIKSNLETANNLKYRSPARESKYLPKPYLILNTSARATLKRSNFNSSGNGELMLDR